VSDTRPSPGPDAHEPGRKSGRRGSGREILRFAAVLLGLSFGLLYLLSGPLAERIQPPLCETVARHTRLLLGLLGEEASVSGTTVFSPRHSFRVVYACTSLPASVLLVSAILAFPAAAWRKTAGILFGVAVLYAVNLVRLVVLYYVHIHRPDAYEKVHLVVWQSLLVVIAVVVFVAWARFAAPGGDDGPR
jgi:exosortase/archaeosortase family protein